MLRYLITDYLVSRFDYYVLLTEIAEGFKLAEESLSMARAARRPGERTTQEAILHLAAIRVFSLRNELRAIADRGGL